MDIETFKRVVSYAALPVLGAIAQHLWSRYRNRLAQLRWTAQFQAMAFATDDFGWGKVDILYNGNPTRNLHIVNVQVQNASNRDLQGIRIDCATDTDSLILRSAGQVRGSMQEFPFADDYMRALTSGAAGTLPEHMVTYWSSHNSFVVPVLNRGGIADFRFLISRYDHATPTCTVSCNHPGASIKSQPLTTETLGVRQGQAQVAGLLLTAVLTGLLIVLPTSKWAATIGGMLLGWFALLVGAIAVRGWRALLRLAD